LADELFRAGFDVGFFGDFPGDFPGMRLPFVAFGGSKE
jgi:hypothetical protein